MRHSLRLLALVVLVASPEVAAQVTFAMRETVVLPTQAQGRADHAALAINPAGDVLVVWHAEIGAPGSPKQVEGVLVRYDAGGAGGEWIFPSASEVIVLGDPLVQVYGPAESCRKPDVVAVGNDFLVVWPRLDGNGGGRLESAFVEVPISGPAQVLTAAPGEGYVLDPIVADGAAGLMPDAVARLAKPLTAGVFYAHASAINGNEREYDLRYVEADYSTLPPSLTGIHVAVPGVPVDVTQGAALGGRVLPDAVEDDFGNLVVAYEEFQLAGHNGAAATDSRIQIVRFAESGGVLTALDGDTLRGTKPAARQRRPNLMTSHVDTRNSVSLAWFQVPEPGDVDAYHVEVDFQGGAGMGAVASTSLLFPNSGSHHDNHPFPLHAKNFRDCLVVRTYSLTTRLLAWDAVSPRRLIEVPSPVDPWRPAAAVLEFGTPGVPNSRLVPICYEGPGPASGVTRIYLVVHRV